MIRRLLDAPGPTTVAIQRRMARVLVAAMFAGFALGRLLAPRA